MTASMHEDDDTRRRLTVLPGGGAEPLPEEQACTAAHLTEALRAAGAMAAQLDAAGLRVALDAGAGRVRACLVRSETGDVVREFPLGDVVDPSRLDVA